MAFRLCLNLNFLCIGFLGYGEEIRKCSQSLEKVKRRVGTVLIILYVIWMGWKRRVFYPWSDQIRSPNLVINAACSPQICVFVFVLRMMQLGCGGTHIGSCGVSALESLRASGAVLKMTVQFWKWLLFCIFSFLAIPQLCHSLKWETTAERPFLTPHFLLFLLVSPSLYLPVCLPCFNHCPLTPEFTFSLPPRLSVLLLALSP